MIRTTPASPLVTTLASDDIANTLSGGRPVPSVPEAFAQLLYDGSLFGVPAAIVIEVSSGAVSG